MYLQLKFGDCITYNKLSGYEHPVEHPASSENGRGQLKNGKLYIVSLLVRKVKLTKLEQKHKMLGLHEILPSGFRSARDVPVTSTTWLQIALNFARIEKIMTLENLHFAKQITKTLDK